MTYPDWLRPIAAAATAPAGDLTQFVNPPLETTRASAVLMLFGETAGRPDVLLTVRAAGLRRHAGQVAFPGGTIDPDDDGPVGTALREGSEETGLDPRGVDVIDLLPTLWIPFTGFAVTPVLAWWREPSPVHVVDEAEVASVHRVSLDDLLDPANRLQAGHQSGHIGPAFRVDGLLIWGFTAAVLAHIFDVAAMTRPWDRTHFEPITGLDNERMR